LTDNIAAIAELNSVEDAIFIAQAEIDYLADSALEAGISLKETFPTTYPIP
jgi:hypothetical protein